MVGSEIPIMTGSSCLSSVEQPIERVVSTGGWTFETDEASSSLGTGSNEVMKGRLAG